MWLIVEHHCASVPARLVSIISLPLSYFTYSCTIKGSQFVHKILRLQQYDREFSSKSTRGNIDALENDNAIRNDSPSASAVHLWKHAANLVHRARSQIHYRNHLKIANSEHMSSVDAFDGANARKGKQCAEKTIDHLDMIVVTPSIDGRLTNAGPRRGFTPVV